jgi:hypothetical protein
MSRPQFFRNSRSSNASLDRHKLYRCRKRSRSWLVRSFRLAYLKLIRLQDNPKVIATGLAVGVFAGSFPFFGMQTLVAIALAFMLRGSKVAAAAATWISNPITYVPFYIFNYKVGKLVLGVEENLNFTLDLESFTYFRQLGAKFAITLLIGCFVVGSILGIITYIASFRFFQRLHRRKLKRKIKERTYFESL